MNRYRRIEVGSLVLGPLLMATGDLIHPEERMDPASQVGFIVEYPSRWYAAHLLLFVGMLLFVPGILALTRLAAERRPALGYAARALMLAGAAALCAVFTMEMLIGRFVADGADPGDARALLEAFQSGPVLGVVLAGVLLFFGGIVAVTVALAGTGGRFRWPALVSALGALLILGEIFSAQVRLSQIGNIIVFGASAWFAWLVSRRNQAGAPRRPPVHERDS